LPDFKNGATAAFAERALVRSSFQRRDHGWRSESSEAHARQRRLSGELAAVLERYKFGLRGSDVTVFAQDRDLRYQRNLCRALDTRWICRLYQVDLSFVSEGVCCLISIPQIHFTAAR
jgi:hypothetical protein